MWKTCCYRKRLIAVVAAKGGSLKKIDVLESLDGNQITLYVFDSLKRIGSWNVLFVNRLHCLRYDLIHFNELAYNSH